MLILMFTFIFLFLFLEGWIVEVPYVDILLLLLHLHLRSLGTAKESIQSHIRGNSPTEIDLIQGRLS